MICCHLSSVTRTKDTYAPAIEKEQQEIMAEHGESLNYDILNAMDNLHRFMKEVLRLHPPLIMLLRYVHTDFRHALLPSPLPALCLLFFPDHFG